jgi:ABC-type multidrug transport system ATPase subunit
MYCLETQKLAHQFSEGVLVLNNIDLKISEGSIYGFLGPNGAGKTTTLKLVLGLLKRQQGDIFVFGEPFEKARIDILQKTGSLIESPSLYSQLTAMENLQVLQKIYQCPKSRMQETLRLVGLTGTGKKKAGQFSLGMRQRLSLAIALLHSPSLLILDEPSNGLDPNGMIEMRELLKKLNREKGITILISSHLLPEIEKLVTHVGLIHKGSLLFQGMLQELMSGQQLSSITVNTSDNEKSRSILKKFGPAAGNGHDKIVLPALAKESVATLNRELINLGIDVYEISTRQNDLESVFIDLTTVKSKDQHDQKPS